jgi:excisionase family DNA binding protein
MDFKSLVIMTTAEVADYLRVHPATVYKLLRQHNKDQGRSRSHEIENLRSYREAGSSGIDRADDGSGRAYAAARGGSVA